MTRTKTIFVPLAKLCLLVTLLSYGNALEAQIEVGAGTTCICSDGALGKIEIVAE